MSRLAWVMLLWAYTVLVNALTVNVGGKDIVLRPPEGYVEPQSQRYIDYQQKRQVESNRVLARFVDPETEDKFLGLVPRTGVIRKIIVSTSRKRQQTIVSPAMFSQIKQMVRQKHSEIPDVLKTPDTLKRGLAKLKITQSRSLGVLEEGDNYISIGMVTHGKISSLSVMRFEHTHSKLLTINVTISSADQSAIDVSKEVKDALSAASKVVGFDIDAFEAEMYGKPAPKPSIPPYIAQTAIGNYYVPSGSQVAQTPPQEQGVGGGWDSNYWECILDNMEDVKNNIVAREVVLKCRKEFPSWSTDKVSKKSSLFGVKTASDCVIKYGDGVVSNLGASHIRQACYKLYSNN